MEFEKKINVGHIIVAVSLIVSVVLYTADIKTSISDEAHARETADRVFSERMENITRILDDIEARVRENDAHRIFYDGHEKRSD